MKFIIAVWHAGGKGKSASLREFGKCLVSKYPSAKIIYSKNPSIHDSGDFTLIVEVNSKVIGIESQGDPNSNLGNRLAKIADNYHCDVILCSTRTRGDTVKSIDKVADKYNYSTIWTSTYQIAKETSQSIVNALKGKHILELIESLSLI